MPSIVETCHNKSGVDKEEMAVFEVSDDFDHLPNSTALKTYIRCFLEGIEMVDRKSNKILLGKASELFVDLTREEQEIYLGMSKGCVKRLRPIKDPLEFGYLLDVCYKRNDNKVNSKYKKYF